MPEIGITGLIVILLVALIVFGPKRLPEMGRSMGRGMREFKDSLTGKLKDEDEEEPAALATTTPVETPAPAPKAEQPTSSSS